MPTYVRYLWHGNKCYKKKKIIIIILLTTLHVTRIYSLAGQFFYPLSFKP